MKLQIASLFLIFVLFACVQVKQEDKKKPNILFLAVDDLRPELGCYGSPVARSPNIDRLASEGLLFKRAFCQQAICGPSRASLMSGVRPESLGVLHNYTLLRQSDMPNVITLPQYFRNNGYETVYCGKIFHGDDALDTLSWSREPARDAPAVKKLPKPVTFALKEDIEIQKADRKVMFAKYGEQAKYGLASGPAFESADVPDQTYHDGYNTDLAIATLKDMLAKNPDKPFFLGLGMKKPHLNWVAPQKYWDMYDTVDIVNAMQTKAPQGSAAMGLHASFELRVRSGIPKEGELGAALSSKCTHAYLACVSYIDAQIGRMVKAIEEAGVRENTIIILWGDHGWHLGDMGIWGKATNYEIATRVPMIICVPEMSDKVRGKSTNALVELVDVYPTLCELAGLDLPTHLDGQSYVPLLKEPDLKWKNAVFSQFPTPALREWGAIPLRPGMRETFFGPLISKVEKRIKEQVGVQWDRELFENYMMGYAMRTDRYRMILWKDRRKQDAPPVFVELYDHCKDPLETKNIADREPQLVQRLINESKGGWNEKSAMSH